MPSDSAEIAMSAAGFQKPAAPSMWNDSPIARTLDACDWYCATAGDAVPARAVRTSAYRRITECLRMSCSVSEKLSEACWEGWRDGTTLTLSVRAPNFPNLRGQARLISGRRAARYASASSMVGAFPVSTCRQRRAADSRTSTASASMMVVQMELTYP